MQQRKRTRKNGEIASQAFVYILGIVVVGLLLLLGFRAINSINEKKCTVQDASFQTDLKAKIEANKGRGKIQIETFTPSCETEEICFVSRRLTDLFDGTQVLAGTELDPDEPQNAAVRDELKKRQFIIDSVVSGDDTNIFIRTSTGYEPLKQFDKAAPIELKTAAGDEAGPITCVSGEPLRIKFLGQGQVVDVEQP